MEVQYRDLGSSTADGIIAESDRDAVETLASVVSIEDLNLPHTIRTVLDSNDAWYRWLSLSRSLLARSPEYPQRIRVASVFEPFDCLFFVLCLFGSKFSNFSSPHLLFYSTVSSVIGPLPRVSTED